MVEFFGGHVLVGQISLTRVKVGKKTGRTSPLSKSDLVKMVYIQLLQFHGTRRRLPYTLDSERKRYAEREATPDISANSCPRIAVRVTT